MSSGTKSDAKNTVIGLIVIAAVIAFAWWGISALVGSKGDKAEANAKADTKQTIATIAGEIEDKNVGGICSYTDKKDEYFNTSSVQKTGTTNFVNLAKEVLKSEKCSSFQYALSIEVKDAHGTASEQPILVFTVNHDNKERFDAYDWGNLKGQSVGAQLQSDSILTKIRTDVKDVSLNDVVYTGESADLK